MSSENFDDEFVELCLACEPNVFRTVVCRFGMGESERGRVWICVTYGVEHETAVSVESDLPFILMGFVLFVVILGGLVYVRVKVKVKEPRPKIEFRKRVGNDHLETRAKYMRVHRQNRPAQGSVTERLPNRAWTSHRILRFPVISPKLQSYQWR